MLRFGNMRVFRNTGKHYGAELPRAFHRRAEGFAVRLNRGSASDGNRSFG